MSGFNQLTVEESERLAILSEELGEAQQVIGKIQRHGYESHNPTKPSLGDNRSQLEVELGDIQAAVQIMLNNNDLEATFIQKRVPIKLHKIVKYLHHTKVKP